MAAQRIEDVLQLLRSEYLDLPGLSLTAAEVARSWTWTSPQPASSDERFEDSRFLERAPNGRFTLSVHQDRDAES